MDVMYAKEIADKYQLISKRDSKIILDSIVKKKPFPRDVCDKNKISLIQYRRVYEDYRQLKKQLARDMEDYPRNYPFYLMAKNIVPEFGWDKRRDRLLVCESDVLLKSKSKYVLKNVYVEKIALSISTILFRQEATMKAGNSWIERNFGQLPRMYSELKQDVSALLQSIDVIDVSADVLMSLLRVLSEAKDGYTVTFISPICPDYSYRVVKKDGKTSHEYTFEYIGDGVGLVASHALFVQESVSNLCRKYGINAKFLLISGDFEAYNESNLEGLEVSEQEFLDAIDRSVRALEEISSYDCVSTTFADFVKMDREEFKKYWKASVEEYETILLRDEYSVQINGILNSRLDLYKRWLGEKTRSDYLSALRSQGAEYAMMGNMFKEEFDNPFVLGVDHHVMKYFYTVVGLKNVIYARRRYE